MRYSEHLSKIRSIVLTAAMVMTFAGSLSGCRTIANESMDGPLPTLTQLDEKTRYFVEPLGDGFAVYVFYDRTRVALPPTVESYLRRTVREVAERHAREVGRSIEPVDPGAVFIQPSRNRLTAQMYWKAWADVRFTER